MRLTAMQTPYSSTVGGGLTLVDENGRARFMVAIFGTTEGITKEETAAIGAALRSGIPAGGIDVPDRPAAQDKGRPVPHHGSGP